MKVKKQIRVWGGGTMDWEEMRVLMGLQKIDRVLGYVLGLASKSIRKQYYTNHMQESQREARASHLANEASHSLINWLIDTKSLIYAITYSQCYMPWNKILIKLKYYH